MLCVRDCSEKPTGEALCAGLRRGLVAESPARRERQNLFIAATITRAS